VHLVAISHQHVSENDLQAMRPFCATVQVFYIRKWLLPFQLAMGWLGGLPLQVSYFLDRTIKRKVQYHIIRLDPDHVICQLIRASPYVRALPFSKTLDYMDVFSEGMRQMNEKHGWFGFPFKWEAKRLAAYERTIYKDFDKHSIISDQDRTRLKLATSGQVAVIPNGVDERFLNYELKQKPNHDLVFVGNLGYGPNIAAVDILVNKIMPALKQRGLNPGLLVAGARPGRKILNLDGRHNVTVRGWVEDIREAYADGRIFVAPMFSGLGLQNKILEAMAMGLPCVTTSMVNNAIGAEHGKEIIVADTVREMTAWIERLMHNTEMHHRVSDAAKEFVMKHYQWEEQVQKLDEFIQAKNVYATR